MCLPFKIEEGHNTSPDQLPPRSSAHPRLSGDPRLNDSSNIFHHSKLKQHSAKNRTHHSTAAPGHLKIWQVSDP